MGQFDNCKTIEELNLERSNLVNKINKEYTERRQALLKTTGTGKVIKSVKLSALEVEAPSLYAAFDIVRGQVKDNEVTMSNSKIFI